MKLMQYLTLDRCVLSQARRKLAQLLGSQPIGVLPTTMNDGCIDPP